MMMKKHYNSTGVAGTSYVAFVLPRGRGLIPAAQFAGPLAQCVSNAGHFTPQPLKRFNVEHLMFELF